MRFTWESVRKSEFSSYRNTSYFHLIAFSSYQFVFWFCTRTSSLVLSWDWGESWHKDVHFMHCTHLGFDPKPVQAGVHNSFLKSPHFKLLLAMLLVELHPKSSLEVGNLCSRTLRQQKKLQKLLPLHITDQERSHKCTEETGFHPLIGFSLDKRAIQDFVTSSVNICWYNTEIIFS